MADQGPSSSPKSLRRRARRALALKAGPLWLLVQILMALLLFLAASQVRLELLPGASVHGDWVHFLRSSNQLALGLPASGSPPPLYTTWPYLFFAGAIELFSDPRRVFMAWAVLAAAAVPVTFLACRRVGGPVAACLAAAVVMVGPMQIFTSIGVRPPYFISLFTALAVLGLGAATARRVWGVPLLVFGLAGANVLHLGLWLMSALGLVFGLVHLSRLPWKRALAAAFSAALAGGAFAGVVVHFDYARLYHQAQIVLHGALMFRPPPDASPERVLWQLLLGLDMREDAFLLLLVLALVAVAVALLRAVLGWWARRRDTGLAALSADHEQRQAAWTGVQALLLAMAGAWPYLKLGLEKGHVEAHHFVALVPVVCVALAGLLRGVAPGRWRTLQYLAATLGFFVWLARPAFPTTAGRATSSARPAGRATGICSPWPSPSAKTPSNASASRWSSAWSRTSWAGWTST